MLQGEAKIDTAERGSSPYILLLHSLSPVSLSLPFDILKVYSDTKSECIWRYWFVSLALFLFWSPLVSRWWRTRPISTCHPASGLQQLESYLCSFPLCNLSSAYMSSRSTWVDQLPLDPNMSKRSIVTNITPLPATITRETAVALLHSHVEMIELNPLVIRHHRTEPPPNASADETKFMTWYELTDEIQYIPGTSVKGEVNYKAGFYDLPRGLQTHVFAPAGVDIQGKWSVGGNAPGEERETMEIGVNKPKDGLYLREDVDLKCNVFLTNFVKRNLKKSHGVLVQRVLQNADSMEEARARSTRPESTRSSSRNSIGQPENGGFSTNVSEQSSHTSRNPTPASRRMDAGACQSQPVQQPMHYSQLRQERSKPASPSQSWEQVPSNTYSKGETHACHCTGGVHVEGCELYPGLRLPNHGSQASPYPAQSYPSQNSQPQSFSQSTTPGPHPPTGSSRFFGQQGYGGQTLEPNHKPLMGQTQGNNVVTELEGDPVMAQKYYEYQSQKAAELE